MTLTVAWGAFLTFRIQREANYHRQPVLDFAANTARGG